ncbi:MAG: hypothetical protein AB8F95_17525 [Bacteroidia bacterium]
MLFRTFILLAILAGIVSDTNAQNSNLRFGYSSTAVGLGQVNPGFSAEVQAKPWTLFHLKNRYLDFQYAWGDFHYAGANNDTLTSEGTLMQAGFVVPLHSLTLLQRKHYLKGLHITPFAGLQWSLQTMRRRNGKFLGQHGINIPAGLSVQFPFGMLDLRMNTGIYFGKPSEELSRYRSNILFTPSWTLQLDGLFEMLGGKVTKGGDYYHTHTYLKSRDRKYIGSGKVEETSTYETTSYSGNTYFNILPGFWYLSGKYSWGNSISPAFDEGEILPAYQPGNGTGVGIGGRYKGFMIDVSMEKNNGFIATRDPKYLEALKPYASSFPVVQGTFNATEIRGKAGFDLAKALTNIIMPHRNRTLRNMRRSYANFSRLHGGLSWGVGMPGEVRMLTEGGGAQLDEFFAQNISLNQDHSNDIRQTRTATTIGLFLNWEFGPVSLEFDWHGNHDFGWRSSYSVSYLVPINLLFKGRE